MSSWHSRAVYRIQYCNGEAVYEDTSTGEQPCGHIRGMKDLYNIALAHAATVNHVNAKRETNI